MLSTALCLVAHELFAPAKANLPATTTTFASQDLEHTLLRLLDRFSLASLGLDKTPPTAPFEFYNIHNCENFEIGVFVLRKGHSMPIHDHPNMTVFTKVVYGDLHVRKFEFVDRLRCSYAKIVRDTICRGTSSSKPIQNQVPSTSNQTIFKAYPADGPNLHSFTALSDFAVILDVFGPPYLRGEREVTYYTEIAPIQSDSSPESSLPRFAAPCLENSKLRSTMFPMTPPNTYSTTSNTQSASEAKLKRKRPPSKDLQEENTFSETARESGLELTISSAAVISETLVGLTHHPSASVSFSQEAATDSGRRDSSLSPCDSEPPIHASYQHSCNASSIKSPSMVWLQPDGSIEFDVVERPYRGRQVADYTNLLDRLKKTSRQTSIFALFHEIFEKE
ncbi:hypothetical protein HDU83_008230 [Entophlyctis luteolus]|nr:hypothetical protein HDU83_008230 [Entophlyctis luteolus]